MVSKLVSLRISEELLTRLEADMIDGESVGTTIQRILNHHYGVVLDSSQREPLQELIANEVEKRLANLTAGYYELTGKCEDLQAQITKLQTVKTTRKKSV
ncbi:hypothetical protein [Kamptonema sp. PCC 6506]|uniref:hypothetical protein n=1 Tax=Kamptonema sp. PCC 6506 TaxID=272129 RepID=UPI0001DAC7EC|nr:hypothetical protein [Kamptonema sp. PCC 6506]CBN54938.1 hypothetical protein OSCI_1230002 [Kamptonema sp. PCC 6506]